MENQDNTAGCSQVVDESVPLLAAQDGQRPRKKPFHRARPLWLVPFALVASLVRGMTLAPRVEVFTQLACHQVYGHHDAQNIAMLPAALTRTSIQANLSLSNSLGSTPGTPLFASETLHVVQYRKDIYDDGDDGDSGVDPSDETSDPRNLPSAMCVANPDVQAGAAQLQMIMTTTMGLLSAFTTGWWGHFGERHGRTRVLAISTFGLFLTDLVFILVSTPSSVLSHHGHKLLLVAPIIEGALGGWSTLQATTLAYVSDCTSSGSRAHTFSRFTGVTYLGILFGPIISGYLIQHSVPAVGGTKSVTSVFWIAIFCSFINFLLAVFIFPESLTKEKREQAIERYNSGKLKAPVRGEHGGNAEAEEVSSRQSFFVRLFSPLAVFLPVRVRDPVRVNKYRRDWSLTWLAVSFFCFMLCAVGVSQLKYLYAEHTYGWGAEELSWYISYLGGMRAIVLLLVLPYVIGVFKPKARDSAKGKLQANGKKPKPTRSQLGREIGFDLMLARCSFLIDIISNLLIIASPAPAIHHSSGLGATGRGKRGNTTGHGPSRTQSQALFVLASGLSSMGTGAAPAIHSLTLCILQARELSEVEGRDVRVDGNDGDGGAPSAEGAKAGNVGGLFGAFAFLQSIGSMILGPMMFGLIYSSTVAAVPKAIFMVGAATMCVSLALVMLVRNPVEESGEGSINGTGKRRRRQRQIECERGRSRVSKDLRGGAAGFEDTIE